MNVKNIVFLLSVVFSIYSCSKDTGQVDVDLDVGSITNSNEITKFVFVVSTTDQIKSFLFPADCLGCKVSEQPCQEANTCVNLSSCGFSVSETNFRPRVSFSDFPEDSDILVIACGLNNSQSVIAAGSGTVRNSDGQSVSITLQANSSVCASSIPVACPTS